MNIGIDFDDVVADSLSLVIRLHNQQYGTDFTQADFTSSNFEKIWGGTREEAIKKVDSFFASDQLKEISPIAGAIKGIKILKEKGHDLFIITGRSTNDVAETERWLKFHFPDVFKGVYYGNFFTLNKESVYRKKIDICKELGIEIMIEDNLPTALECAVNGMKVFLFDKPWNPYPGLPSGVMRVHSWDEVVDSLKI
jgi:uncharacterized HAD superfamily protein